MVITKHGGHRENAGRKAGQVVTLPVTTGKDSKKVTFYIQKELLSKLDEIVSSLVKNPDNTITNRSDLIRAILSDSINGNGKKTKSILGFLNDKN
jgi:hypothetical protein